MSIWYLFVPKWSFLTELAKLGHLVDKLEVYAEAMEELERRKRENTEAATFLWA